MNSRTLERMFGYTTPTEEEIRKCGIIRCNARELAKTFNAHLPECREKSLAIQAIKEAVNQAYAAIRSNSREEAIPEAIQPNKKEEVA